MADSTLPLVSMVTPTYNRVELLPETIDSLLAQEYPRLEVIVIDDGSTDGTAELLAQYAAREPERFRWSRHEHAGQAASVNHGFAMARGELLAMISSDDPQPPGLIAPLVDYLLEHPDVVVAYPDWEMIDQDGGYVQSLETLDYSFVDMVRWHECLPGPGALIRRQVLDAVGGWNTAYRYVADYEWYLRAGLAGRFVRVPRSLARWREHPRSITVAERSEAMAREMVAVTEAFFARTDLPDEIQAVRAEAFRNAYVIAGICVSPNLDGLGTRFLVNDRIQPLKANVDLRRQPAMQSPSAMVVALHGLVAEHVRTIEWLHREVAERDATIRWLHGEVADRDKTVAWLHGEVAARDRLVTDLRAAADQAPPRPAESTG